MMNQRNFSPEEWNRLLKKLNLREWEGIARTIGFKKLRGEEKYYPEVTTNAEINEINIDLFKNLSNNIYGLSFFVDGSSFSVENLELSNPEKYENALFIRYEGTRITRPNITQEEFEKLNKNYRENRKLVEKMEKELAQPPPDQANEDVVKIYYARRASTCYKVTRNFKVTYLILDWGDNNIRDYEFWDYIPFTRIVNLDIYEGERISLEEYLDLFEKKFAEYTPVITWKIDRYTRQMALFHNSVYEKIKYVFDDKEIYMEGDQDYYGWFHEVP